MNSSQEITVKNNNRNKSTLSELEYSELMMKLRKIDQSVINNVPEVVQKQYNELIGFILDKCNANPSNLEANFLFYSLPKLVLRNIPKETCGDTEEDFKKYCLQILERIKVFRSNWREVWDQIAGGKSYGRCVQQHDQEGYAIRTAKKLVALGRDRNAKNVLESKGKAVIDNEGFVKLQEKFPQNIGMRIIPEEDPPEIIKVQPKIVRKSIYSFNKNTSCGRDSWKISHIISFIKTGVPHYNNVNLKTLTKFINNILSGKLPKTAAPFFTSAPLLLFVGQDSVPRPIACGEIFRRLSSKVLVASQKLAIKKQFGNTGQMAISETSGGEKIIHIAQSIVAKNGNQKGLSVLKIDLKNAFNSVDRNVMFKEVRSKLPRMSRYVEYCYGNHSYKFVEDRLIISQTGVDQGDPLGPVLFSLVLNRVIKKIDGEFNDVLMNAWFLDDGLIIAPVKTLQQIVTFMQKEFTEIGLELNMKKTTVWWTSMLDEWKDFHQDIIRDHNSFLPLLGGFIYNPEKDTSKIKFIEQKLEGINKLVVKINKIEHPQTQYILIKNCVASSIIHLLRITNFPLIKKYIKEFDTILNDALRSILGAEFSFYQRKQMALPIKMGGMGIPIIKNIADIAYLSSFSASCGAFKKLTKLILEPFKSSIFTNTLKRVNDAFGEGSNFGITNFTAQKAQKAVSKMWAEKQVKWLLQKGSRIDKARITSLQVDQAGTFYSFRPDKKLNTYMTLQEFQAFAGYRMGIPLYKKDSLCKKCKERVDVFGAHTSTCKFGKEVINRHDKVRDTLGEIGQQMGLGVKKEAKLPYSKDNKRPGDVQFNGLKPGKTIDIDVTLKCPISTSNIDNAIDGSLLKNAEEKKIEKYKNKKKQATFLDDYEFMVFAMNTFGGISIQGNRVIGRMAMGLGNVLNISGKEAAKIIRHRVIASCAKAVAHQLLMQKVHTEPG
eukprot:TRINITY_DN1999_c0_g1_i12.p1 TRINITY_DN1999_c0_g1~~TRINITY_DN1999_c0_g1_i12.p1  ORF type:complete len:1018 (+),score=208.55 TRINITY_DN1999_c0_g1_i12:231-3056(+)